MEEKRNNGILILFIILTILLGGFIIFDKFINVKNNDKVSNNNSINNNTTTQESTKSSKSFKDIAGKYNVSYKKLSLYDSNNSVIAQNLTATINLNLYDNGIFTYENIINTQQGTIGNYIIDDNKIILTNWFETNSGTGVYAIQGTKTLIIDNDGNILDNNMDIDILKDNNINSIKLIKTGVVDQFSLYNKLKENEEQ